MLNNEINKKTEEIKNNLLNKISEIKRMIDNTNYNLNKKMNNNLIEKELKELLRLNEKTRYLLVREHEFKNNPINLKYKVDITNINDNYGVNDIFEIFISFKDLTEYIVSPNYNNFNLDIYIFDNNLKISSLSGHKNHVKTIKYFIDKGNYNEYLISGDSNQIVIVWDISLNFIIKYQINTNYESYSSIFSCLIFLSNNYCDYSNYNYLDNYIIISSRNTTKDIDKSSTKIYSLKNGQFLRNIKDSNNHSVFYLLAWYNKKNEKFYIIQLAEKKIVINNLLEDELYCELINEPEDSHYSGFIYNKDDKDFLFSSSFNGRIDIWDLYNKKIFQVIKLNKCNLFSIIKWNKKYIIVADYKNISLKIIDLTKNKVVEEIIGEHKRPLKCIKKWYSYKKFGEMLLISGNDKIIKLWHF